MSDPLTSNTQAILLLTAPLIVGRGGTSPDVLTLGEYNRLARLLHANMMQPADMIGARAAEAIELAAPAFGLSRLMSLLGRGFLLGQAVDHWNTRSIWVVSRADTNYPQRIRNRLKGHAPPVLFGCGNVDLLDSGGFAVVGSRHVDTALIAYTENMGRLAAEAGRTLISGGARGIDLAAMHGALRHGGSAVAVLSDSLERAALSRDNRQPLLDGLLTLISPYDPRAGFNVGHAMQRNKLIYGLADVALVVNADFEKGGTWAGAIEQLERLHFVPVFVRSTGAGATEATTGGTLDQGREAGNGRKGENGNAALLRRGGLIWPDPLNPIEFIDTMAEAIAVAAAEPSQESLVFEVREPAAEYGPLAGMHHDADTNTSTPAPENSLAPSDAVFAVVRTIMRRELVVARTPQEIAKLLGVLKPQALAWLSRMVAEGLIEEISGTKPVQFRAIEASRAKIEALG